MRLLLQKYQAELVQGADIGLLIVVYPYTKTYINGGPNQVTHKSTPWSPSTSESTMGMMGLYHGLDQESNIQ